MVLGTTVARMSAPDFEHGGFVVPLVHHPNQPDEWYLANHVAWSMMYKQILMTPRHISPAILAKFGSMYSQAMK